MASKPARKSVSRSLRVGDRVRCEREAPSKGSWPRFAGKVGTVVSVGEEIGVDLSPSANSRGQAFGFLRSELVLIERAPADPAEPDDD